MGILYGHGEGGHQDVAAACVDIWFRPIAGLVLQRLHEPLLRGIIVLGGGKGGEAKSSAWLLEHIRGEERPAGQISWHHGHGRAHHDGIVLNYALGYPVQAVRHVQAPLCDPHAVADRGFRLVDDVHYLVLRGLQLAFGTLVRLFLHPLPGEGILQNGGGLEDDDHHDDDHQSSPRPLANDFCYLSFHRTLFRASRNSGIGRRVSRSMMMVLRPAYGRICSSMSASGLSEPK